MPNDKKGIDAPASRVSSVCSIRLYPELEAAITKHHEQLERDCQISLSRGEVLRSLLEEQLIALHLLDPATPQRKRPALDALMELHRKTEGTNQ